MRSWSSLLAGEVATLQPYLRNCTPPRQVEGGDVRQEGAAGGNEAPKDSVVVAVAFLQLTLLPSRALAAASVQVCAGAKQEMLLSLLRLDSSPPQELLPTHLRVDRRTGETGGGTVADGPSFAGGAEALRRITSVFEERLLRTAVRRFWYTETSNCNSGLKHAANETYVRLVCSAGKLIGKKEGNDGDRADG